MPSTLDLAMIWLRRAEGVVDHAEPGDPGGETYTGISRATWPAWSGWPILDRWHGEVMPSDIRQQVDSLVDCFYISTYWTPRSLGNFPAKSGVVLLDTMVQHGRGVQIIQACLNMHYHLALSVDNRWGPATYGAVFGLACQPRPAEAALIETILNAREATYRGLAAHGQAQDLTGWLNRLTNLRAYLDTLGASTCAAL